MSAYVIVELTVKDPAAMARYSAAAGPIVEQFGGEFVVRGTWDILTGEPAVLSGAIIRFPDHDTALTWYNSHDYQATIANRSIGMDCRFRLIG